VGPGRWRPAAGAPIFPVSRIGGRMVAGKRKRVVRSWPFGRSGAWRTVLLVVLVGLLTAAHLMGLGRSFPTLVDFLGGG